VRKEYKTNYQKKGGADEKPHARAQEENKATDTRYNGTSQADVSVAPV
jgi:hypothetical protein